MTTMQRNLGAAIETPSADHTTAIAERLGVPAPRTVDEALATPAGSMILCESSCFTAEDLITIGARFRALGLQLVVATRDVETLPFELRRNLAELVTEQSLTSN
jgi:hypothetical protein